MNARIGDWVVVESGSLGGARRIGRIIALRHPDGSPPYEVRWTDTDKTTVIYPGPDMHVMDSLPADAGHRVGTSRPA